MFDENDGDELEDRDFLDSFVAGDDESMKKIITQASSKSFSSNNVAATILNPAAQ